MKPLRTIDHCDKLVSSGEREAQRLERARRVLVQGQSALGSVALELHPNFAQAVQLILEISSSGRLIVVGVGKTGFVGMKLSATFASIGVRSFFLHPTEALHGDLGRLSHDDLVLLLSNSGENPEITGILPHLRKLACKTIAITSGDKSSLAQGSDLVVPIGKIQEAGPLGLAPTTSTLVLLALGDALAMTVLHERPIDRKQFAQCHPGGALGRSLMLVSEVMRTGDENCVMPSSATCGDVLRHITLTKNRPGAASIVDVNGRLVGVFTDGDLRRCLEKQADFLSLPVSAVMGQNPKTVAPNVIAEEALSLMTTYRIDQVIVVDESGQPVGMVDIQDLV